MKVIGLNNAHNYPLGEVLSPLTSSGSIIYGSNAASSYISGLMRKSGSLGNSIYMQDLAIVGTSQKGMMDEIKDLQAQKKEIDAEIKVLREKIAFVKDRGIKEFNEEIFKNWRILKEINANMDKLDSYDFAASLTELIQG